MAKMDVCCFSVCLKSSEQRQSPSDDSSQEAALLSRALGFGENEIKCSSPW